MCLFVCLFVCLSVFSPHDTSGHCNIEGNERADRLAKQAAETHFIGPEPVVGITADSVRLAAHKWAIREQIRHLLGNCPATVVNRNALMGACTLTPEDLRGFHWSILLRFAKNSGCC